MKKIVPIVILAMIVLISCQKNTGSVPFSQHCDALITDTAGTNDSGRIYMPTAFTPNGDGLNDFCRPYGQNLDSITFTIYNANNVVVFSTTEFYQGWAPTVTSNTDVKFHYTIQAITTANRKIGVCGDVYELTCLPAGTSVNSFLFEDQITPNGFDVPSSEILSTCP
ncbi:MAG TPA: hypothetical protein VK559_09200 [Ferruginibacter sp.]|nr:hypothetical protein [Ferruginibacter sp.]